VSRDKRCTEEDVVAELRSGMTIGIGGWGSRRKPMSIIRAILRYALSCQDEVPAAKELVKKIRAEDAELVKDAEELLRLEASIKPKS